MLLQDWIGPQPNFVLVSEELDKDDGFPYLGIYNKSGGRKSNEFSSCIQKARLTFANLSHRRCRRDIKLHWDIETDPTI